MKGEFSYRVRYQRRKTLALHVLEDGQVEVRAPRGLSEAHIVAWVESRVEWIRAARERVARRQRQHAAWQTDLSAAKTWFLGQPLTLQWETGKRASVQRCERVLRVTLPATQALPQAARLLDRWYALQAQTVLEERFELGWRHFARRFGDRVKQPQLRLRRMRRRWGSCSSRGVVTLNRELIKLPLALADYVIAHEFCHLLEFNHSPRFYQLLTELMPDWRQRKQELDGY